MATIETFISEWNNNSEYIHAHTSGSTGTPKPINLLKADMRSSATATNVFFGINSKSVLGLPLSVDYIAGKMMVVRSLLAGCNLISMPVSNTIKLESHIDLLAVVPTQLDSILSNSKTQSLIGNLLIGGAPLSEEAEQAVVSSGIPAWLGFGMTETCSHVALRRVGSDKVFQAMPGIEFDINNDGCLIIKSGRFSWKELKTNDIVELIDAGHFRWVGRADNVINSGGLKLHPEQLESIFKSCINNLPPFYLKGETDETLGQRLVMVVENPPLDLMATLKNGITNHKLLPKKIIAVDKLSRTSNGKIKRL